MHLRNLASVPIALVLGCQDAAVDTERCDDVTAQIELALEEYTQSQLLVPGAVPCELTPDAFDQRVEAASREYLLGAFANACEVQAEACGGSPQPSSILAPPSISPAAPPPSAPAPYVSGHAPD
jgi:hypothetical protein